MEIWKDVIGYEGFYQVSNEGNVRNLAVYSYKYKRVVRRKNPRLLRPETTHEGYKRVVLSLYGNKKKHSIHRLVAFAFIPNPDGLPEVNHKDEDTGNNTSSNLEWCSRSYNANYGTLPQRIKKRMNTKHPTTKSVIQYSLEGKYINTFPSIREAEKATGIDNTMISRVCLGKANKAGNYKWKYAK